MRWGDLRRAGVVVALLAAPASGQTLPSGDRGRADDPDAPVRALVAEIRSRVGAISLDGRSADWAGVPVIADRSGDAGGDRSRDIVGVAIVPTDDALLVQIRTAGPPSREDRAFWLNVDVAGSLLPDLQLGIVPEGVHWARVYAPDGRARTLTRSAFAHAVGEVLEVGIPMAELERLLHDRPPLRGPDARPWVRVTALTWRRDTGDFVDFAAAASYRIVPGLGDLDPALPRPSRGPDAVIPLPLDGRWYVSQGAYGHSSHADIWAYDLSVVDEGISFSVPRESCTNADFLGWGREVRSPVSATVIRIRREQRDSSPCDDGDTGPPNEVYLDLGDDVGLWLAHFRQGSVVPEAGSRVVAGAPLGRVGNSGRSSGPHLHLGLYRISEGQTTLPLAFRDGRLGLNPGPDDPWGRDVDVWAPRDGFFVEPRGSRGPSNP